MHITMNLQVREVCWFEFMRDLNRRGASIRALTELHHAYVSKIERKCLVHSDIAVTAVQQMLTTVADFCNALYRPQPDVR